jgi:hypothetical protein
MPFQAGAQSTTDMAALKGLAPVTVLSHTPEGKAALAATYTVTGGIQTGAMRQSTLFTSRGAAATSASGCLYHEWRPCPTCGRTRDETRSQLPGACALHRSDAFHQHIPGGCRCNCLRKRDHRKRFERRQILLRQRDDRRKTPVSAEALAILKEVGGDTDIFGKSYGLPAGSSGADAYGDSRPFQTEPSVSPIVGPDYFNVPADNGVYNRGPLMNLINSPSYPSGHSTYGYTGALILAILVPQRYQQMIARGAEYGNDRIPWVEDFSEYSALWGPLMRWM